MIFYFTASESRYNLTGGDTEIPREISVCIIPVYEHA